MNKLNIISDIFDLFEVYGNQNFITEFIDNDIIKLLPLNLYEVDTVGISDRFSQLLDRVRTAATQAGDDRVRNIIEMLKTALLQYIKTTNDTLTGRSVFNKSIQKGLDMMVTVTAVVILANALSKNHLQQAIGLVQGVEKKLSGAQNGQSISDQATQAIGENTSGSATSSGAIAAIPTGRKIIKKRRDSIFAEENSTAVSDVENKLKKEYPNNPGAVYGTLNKIGLKRGNKTTEKGKQPAKKTVGEGKMLQLTVVDDGQDNSPITFSDLVNNTMIPTTMDNVQHIRQSGNERQIQGVMIDPTTAELISAAHGSLNFENQQRYSTKSITEMVRIANRLVESGFLKIDMQES